MLNNKVARIIVVWLVILIQFSFSASVGKKISGLKVSVKTGNETVAVATLYDSLGLNSLGLSKAAYDCAMKGYRYFLTTGQIANNMVISIIDFSLPSNAKRLFVLDLQKGILLFNTYVAHGRNSGKNMATEFSNNPSSLKSSLGFYITSGTYRGKHGYSLKLMGEEEGINDNAAERAIVMHAAPYVNESMIRSQGFIGRSLGCPAIPVKVHKAIIEKIKNGSTLFMYSPDEYYLSHSSILNDSVAG
jgi:hypothetical protein